MDDNFSLTKKKSKRNCANKKTNTPPEFAVCQKCVEKDLRMPSGNIIGDCCSTDVLEDYIKAINYINSCHSIINEITKGTTNHLNLNMPDVPNFLAIFRSLNNCKSETESNSMEKLSPIVSNTPPTRDTEVVVEKISSDNSDNSSSKEDSEETEETENDDTGKKQEAVVDSKKAFINLVPDIKTSVEHEKMDFSQQNLLCDEVFTTDSSDNEIEILQNITFASYRKDQMKLNQTNSGSKEILQSQTPVISDNPVENVPKNVSSNRKISGAILMENNISKIIHPHEDKSKTKSKIPSILTKGAKHKNGYMQFTPNSNDHISITLSQEELDKYAKELLQSFTFTDESSNKSITSDGKRVTSKPSLKQVKPRTLQQIANDSSNSSTVSKASTPKSRPSTPQSRPSTPKSRPSTPKAKKSSSYTGQKQKCCEKLSMSNIESVKYCQQLIEQGMKDRKVSIFTPSEQEITKSKNAKARKKSKQSVNITIPLDNPSNNRITNSLQNSLEPKNARPSKKSQRPTNRTSSPSPSKIPASTRIKYRSHSPHSNEAKRNLMMKNVDQNVQSKLRPKRLAMSTTNKMGKSNSPSSGGSVILSDSDPICTDSDIDEDYFHQVSQKIEVSTERLKKETANNVINLALESLKQGQNTSSITPEIEQQIIAATSSRVDLNQNVFRRPRKQYSVSSEDEDDKILRFSEEGEPKICSSRTCQHNFGRR